MPDTDNIPSPAAPAATGPQRIAPAAPDTTARGRSGSRRGWIVASSVAVAGVLAALGVTAFVIARNGVSNGESQVRDAVDSFVDALGSGDLPALQASTCGTLADFYRDIPPAAFAGVHRDAVTDGSVPVVTSIDSVQITGDSAMAQVTAHTAAAPAASQRTFDLQRIGGAWKVCNPA